MSAKPAPRAGTFRSLTGRTVVTASVGERGEVEFKVTRNGQVLNTFSVGREQDIAGHEIEQVGDEVHVFHQGPEGRQILRRIPIE